MKSMRSRSQLTCVTAAVVGVSVQWMSRRPSQRPDSWKSPCDQIAARAEVGRYFGQVRQVDRGLGVFTQCRSRFNGPKEERRIHGRWLAVKIDANVATNLRHMETSSADVRRFT